MFETTKEDMIKSRLAKELNLLPEFDDIYEYYRELKKRYEDEKYQENDNSQVYKEEVESKQTKIHKLINLLFSHYPLRRIHRDSLEAKLSEISLEYARADEKSRRELDLIAYKTIMWCKECKKNKSLVKYYYKEVYFSLKRYHISKNDFLNGIYYIEDQEEDI
jgi:hypothetical protein